MNRACYTFWCLRTKDFDPIWKKLQERVFGQDEALTLIRSMLKPKLAETDDPLFEKKPVVLHLVGDNGTGKSLTTSIISEYSFLAHIGRKREGQSNFLYQDGADYSPPAKIEKRPLIAAKLTRKLKSRIADQINSCAKSIIIIDDMQKMMYEVLMSLGNLLEGGFEHNDKRVSTRDAIFIFTSDLGYEDLTRSMSLIQLKQFIFEKTKEFIVDHKLAHVLFSIPFRSLDKSAISKIITDELRLIKCRYQEMDSFSFEEPVVNHLTDFWFQYDSIRKKNGRGISNEVIHTLISPLIDMEIEKIPRLARYSMRLDVNNGTLTISSKILMHIKSEL